MKLGIVDTMFSRVNMGDIAIEEVKGSFPDAQIRRTTVPGVKDLPVECKKLLDDGCDSCLALGMVGGAPIDTQCAHEASLGIQQAKLMAGKHIVEVFVHENEAWSAKEFVEICNNRVRKHAHNAVLLVERPDELIKNAGRGVRQGKEDEGPIEEDLGIKVAVVVGKTNGEITSMMEEKAREELEGEGIEYMVLAAPGAYDMPLLVKKLLMDKMVDGVVALGAVVKGDTAHDKVIAEDSAKRLGELSLEFSKPVALGIIGHDADWETAEERAEEYAIRSVKAVLHSIKTLRD
ncbi:riboflavin synthase [Candidatus Micrarchaeota archaeon]|nr:riboflavin synthase [Candidatus Micrarchaeota archaeon]